MNIISAEGISKSYSEKPLFNKISLGISQGEKVALVGINGSGKTTLLNILAGQIAPDEGSVSLRRGVTLSYLPQHPDFGDAKTVWQAIFETENELLKAVRAYDHSLVTGNGEELSKAIEQMDALSAWDMEAKIRQVMGKLGLYNPDQPLAQLSGGQRKRVALARMLLTDADIYILDEPTNHLDLEIIEWLEQLLSGQQRSLLLVTHDRYFLDRVANTIIELDQGQISRYIGNYGQYLEKKEERMLQQQTEVDKARNLMRKELDWIRRQPKARGTKARYRVNAFEDLKEKAKGKAPEKSMEINVGMQRMGKKIIEIEHLSKKFDELVVLKDFSYTFKRQDRIGIIGPNGTGKSTFLNMLTGQLQPDSGTISKGENTHVGYYTQHGMDLSPDMRVIDVVKEVAEVIETGTGEQITASQLLTHFQFPPRQQYTPVAKLSGGEKRRLQLLRVLMSNPNFLILDEPANDLDIVTLNILEDFLEQYPGCLILVSHDRYLMDRLVDHLFIFEGNGVIRDFPGNYSDYKESLELQAAEAGAASKREADKVKSDKPAKGAVPESASRKLSFKEKKEFESLEAEIAVLESRKAALTQQLTDAASASHQEITAWSEEIAQVTALIDEKSMRWLELSELM